MAPVACWQGWGTLPFVAQVGGNENLHCHGVHEEERAGGFASVCKGKVEIATAKTNHFVYMHVNSPRLLQTRWFSELDTGHTNHLILFRYSEWGRNGTLGACNWQHTHAIASLYWALWITKPVKNIYFSDQRDKQTNFEKKKRGIHQQVFIFLHIL